MKISSATVDDGNVDDLLQASESLDLDMFTLLGEAGHPESQRQAICLAYCNAALEHGTSQRVLIGVGLHGTALALIRLHYETVVRATWTHYGAKDEWIAKFSAPVPDGDLNEPQMGPPLPAMLDAIELQVPQAAFEFRRLHRTIKVMHSFVHGGAHMVVQALRGYPPEKLDAVLRNRNLLTLMLANVIAVSSQRPSMAGAVRRLMASHAFCMPPANAPITRGDESSGAGQAASAGPVEPPATS